MLSQTGSLLIHRVWLICLISCFLSVLLLCFICSFAPFVAFFLLILLHPLPVRNERILAPFMLQMQAILGDVKGNIWFIFRTYDNSFFLSSSVMHHSPFFAIIHPDQLSLETHFSCPLAASPVTGKNALFLHLPKHSNPGSHPIIWKHVSLLFKHVYQNLCFGRRT